MAAYIDDTVLDGALNIIKNNAVRVAICSSQPANYAAIAAATLAEFTVAAGDFTAANGDASGRKLTMGAKTGATASGTGTATHAAFHNNSSILYAVATVTSQAITSGNTVNIGSFDVLEIPDA